MMDLLLQDLISKALDQKHKELGELFQSNY